MHQVYKAIETFNDFNNKDEKYRKEIYDRVSQELGDLKMNVPLKEFLSKAIAKFNIEPVEAVKFAIENSTGSQAN